MRISSRSFLFLGDIVALILAFFVSANASEFLMNRDYLDFAHALGKERVLSLSVIAVMVLLSFYNKGHYIRRIPWWNQFRFIGLVCFVAMVVDGFLHFAIKYQFSRLWLVSTWIYAAALIILIRQIIKILLDKVFNAWFVDTYIIGTGDDVVDAVYALSFEEYTGYRVKAILTFGSDVSFDISDLPLNGANEIKIIRDAAECFSKLNNDSVYIVILDGSADPCGSKVLNELVEKNLNYCIAPSIKSNTIYGNVPQFFFGHDFMLFNTGAKIQSPVGKFLKRAVDIALSSVGLMFLFLLLVVLYPFIRRDGGPLLYPNVRIGKNGEKFECLKIRTMAVDAEARLETILNEDAAARSAWETHRKLENDPRITKIGSFLRKTSLDEIPQLLNVFKGEMSLVGPRPILPDEKKFFDSRQFKLYCSVRPGITGLWQVTGRSNTSFKRRVELDSWYITNWSIWHDIVILFKTAFILLKRSGAH